MYRGFTLGRSPANMLHLKPFNFNYTVGTGTQNSNVVRDQIICFPRLAREGEDPVLFRGLQILDEEKQEPIVCLSNLLDDDGPAFGAPGVAPTWTSSKKDAVSTAYSASSRVWFTVSHGTLNEIYYPTIDRPQTRDMELLFTDGETFFHEEKRDLKYEFHYIDHNAPAIRLIGNDPQGRYTVTKEIVSDRSEERRVGK